MNKIISFNSKGYVHKKKIINKSNIKEIKEDMISIMKNYVKIYKYKDIDKTLDKGFIDISRKSPELRSNIFKAFCQLYTIPKLIYRKQFNHFLKNIGFKNPIIIGFGIIAMEPNEKRFLFNLHQDLRTVFASYHAANLWIPLTSGNDLGGMGIYNKSFELGPIKHSVSKVNGHEEVSYNYTKKFINTKITNLQEGDCFVFSPFSLHYSIPNFGKKIRWTARLVIDDVSKSKHFSKMFEPYNRKDYCDTRTNEERLLEKFGKFKK